MLARKVREMLVKVREMLAKGPRDVGQKRSERSVATDPCYVLVNDSESLNVVSVSKKINIYLAIFDHTFRMKISEGNKICI